MANFTKTEVDYKEITEEPLSAFVDWMLYSFNKKYETIALSHFGVSHVKSNKMIPFYYSGEV